MKLKEIIKLFCLMVIMVASQMFFYRNLEGFHDGFRGAFSTILTGALVYILIKVDKIK